MYSLTLVTTGNNAVRDYLENNYHDCCVLDCSLYSRKDLFDALADYRALVLLTYRCPYIIPQKLVDIFPIGAFNIHPSLLPKYAGLNPWDTMIANGESEGGVTIHRLSQEPDSGENIMQSALPLDFTKGLDCNRRSVDILASTMIEDFLNTLSLQA